MISSESLILFIEYRLTTIDLGLRTKNQAVPIYSYFSKLNIVGV